MSEPLKGKAEDPISSKSKSKKPKKRPFIPKWRHAARIFSGFIIIPILLAFAWLNLFGVPKSLHPFLINSIDQDGLEIIFDDVHFNILSGVYIRKGALSTQSKEGKIFLEFESAKLGYGFFNTKIIPSFMEINGGALKVTTAEDTWVICDGVETSLDLSEDDVTEISSFTGNLLGGKIYLDGMITNAWSAISTPENTKRSLSIPKDYNEISQILNRIKPYIKDSSPSLRVHVSGDAEHPDSFEAELFLNFPRLSSDQFSVTNLVTKLGIHPHKKKAQDCVFSAKAQGATFNISTNRISILNPSLKFNLADIRNSQNARISANGRKIEFSGLPGWLGQSPEANAVIKIPEHDRSLDLFDQIENLSFSLNLLSSKDPIEIEQPSVTIIKSDETPGGDQEYDVYARLTSFGSKDIRSDDLELTVHSIKNFDSFIALNTDINKENWLQEFYTQLYQVSARINNLHVNDVEIGSLQLEPLQQDNEVNGRETKFTAVFESGERIDANISYPSASEPLRITGKSKYDVKKWSPFFGENLNDILSRIHWDSAPLATFNIGPSPLPENVNFEKIYEWFSNSSNFHGHIDMASGAFKGIPFDNLEGDYYFSDLHWYLKDVSIERPEGNLEIDFIQNDSTEVYEVDIKGPIFVRALRPLFEDNSEYYFSKISESSPMSGNVTVGGPWDMDLGWIKGNISHSNATWKTNQVKNLEFYIDYNDTESFLTLKDIQLNSSPHKLSAKKVTYDRRTDFLTFEGVDSSCTPALVADCIYDDPVKFVNSMGFEKPGKWVGGGSIDLSKEPSSVDLSFSLEHQELNLFDIQFTNFKSFIFWKNDFLIFRDINSNFMGGNISGNLNLGIKDLEKTKFNLSARGKQINLNQFASILSKSANVDGRADVDLTISDGIIQAPETWEGSGSAILNDGNFWSIPLFGALSSAIDWIIPGLGHSIFKKGEISLTMKNGNIDLQQFDFSSDKFGIYASGKITTKGKINGSGKIRLFQNDRPIKRLINLTLAPVTESMKFNVSGEVSKPEVTPSYVIPRVLLNPLKPKRWLK